MSNRMAMTPQAKSRRERLARVTQEIERLRLRIAAHTYLPTLGALSESLQDAIKERDRILDQMDETERTDADWRRMFAASGVMEDAVTD